MKKWIWQKYSWWRHLFSLLYSITENLFIYLTMENKEISRWHRHEVIEGYRWIRIHLSFKNKRIK